MTNTVLEELKQQGLIKDYSYNNVDETGSVGRSSTMRNTEQLVLVFPNDAMLWIDTACSGCLEDTTLTFSN